jgi:hypothetical protein
MNQLFKTNSLIPQSKKTTQQTTKPHTTQLKYAIKEQNKPKREITKKLTGGTYNQTNHSNYPANKTNQQTWRSSK